MTRYVLPTVVLVVPFFFCVLRLSVEDGDIARIKQQTSVCSAGASIKAICGLQQPIAASFLSTTRTSGRNLLLIQLAKILMATITTFLTTNLMLSSIFLTVIACAMMAMMIIWPMYDTMTTRFAQESCVRCILHRSRPQRSFSLVS